MNIPQTIRRFRRWLNQDPSPQDRGFITFDQAVDDALAVCDERPGFVPDGWAQDVTAEEAIDAVKAVRVRRAVVESGQTLFPVASPDPGRTPVVSNPWPPDPVRERVVRDVLTEPQPVRPSDFTAERGEHFARLEERGRLTGLQEGDPHPRPALRPEARAWEATGKAVAS
jgi:hypothetical protein